MSREMRSVDGCGSIPFRSPNLFHSNPRAFLRTGDVETPLRRLCCFFIRGHVQRLITIVKVQNDSDFVVLLLQLLRYVFFFIYTGVTHTLAPVFLCTNALLECGRGLERVVEFLRWKAVW